MQVHPSASGASASANPRVGDDADTCRICRGEGTQEEPLFHPCKCSGSIGHVHQECLMEWLSHSQKKHCELCKTSFRFTKLYDPKMPDHLPTAIFLRRAILHVFNGFLLWCRGILVFVTWFIWLPWSMRFVWWGLFWTADGGWSNNTHPQALLNSAGMSSSVANSTTLNPIADSLTDTMSNRGDRTAFWLLELWRSVLPSYSNVDEWQRNSTNGTEMAVFPERGTLLSKVRLIRELTPSPLVNNFLLDVSEGGVIALSVVAAFILVFLIREWVVQQQPIINLDVNDARPPENENHVDGELEEALVEEHEDLRLDDSSQGQASGSDESEEREHADGQYLQDVVQELVQELGAIREELKSLLEYASAGGDALDIDRIIERLQRTTQQLETTSRSLKMSELHHLMDILRTFDALPSGLSTIQTNELTACIITIRAAAASLALAGLQQPPSTDTSILAMEDHGEGPATLSQAEQNGDTMEMVKDDESGPDESRCTSNHSDHDDKSHSEEIRELANANSLPTKNDAGSVQSLESWQNVEHDASDSCDRAQVAVQEAMQNGHRRSEMLPHAEASDSHTATTTHETNREKLNISDQTAPETSSSNQGTRDSGHTEMGDEHQDISSVGVNAQIGDVQVQVDQSDVGPNEHVKNSLLPRFNQLLVWMWDDDSIQQINEIGEDEEHIVQNLEAEAPFVPVQQNRNEGLENAVVAEQDLVHDPEVAAAAVEAGINPNEQEVQEDVEDLEGLLELIGMQGPIAGLFQNAIFVAVVVSATVGVAVWFPYLSGKATILIAAYPLYTITIPYRFLEVSLTIFVDFFLWFGGEAFMLLGVIGRIVFAQLTSILPVLGRIFRFQSLGPLSQHHANSALLRLRTLIDGSIDGGHVLQPHFSLSAHVALRRIQFTLRAVISLTTSFLSKSCGLITWIFTNPRALLGQILRSMLGFPPFSSQSWNDFISAASYRWAYAVQNIAAPLLAEGATHDLGQWTVGDRSIAILSGYALFAMIGTIYLSHLAPVSSSIRARKVEEVIIEILHQAGGVLKVILIISIEMLAFPLYCGFLLDFAMLPLFGDATFSSRITYAFRSPWTSAFVHWFIGTCYMFHFALFVSMCRRILRSGVLYFIRDPDDPTFHPIRDVLERSVSSQLRKIGFSALIYGGLVTICLGSVVWALAASISNILPIRWMPAVGFMAFPFDLLIYTILKPLAVRFLTPTDGLNMIYEWWFRQCARRLRLSNFLLGPEVQEEINWLDLPDESGHDQKALDGRFARVPASDQVRIPRGQRSFLEVDEKNNRVDGQPDPDQGLHGRRNDNFKKVYIPSNFKLRIAAFIVCLWALTALVGLSLSIAPLLLGRFLLGLAMPSQVWASDIYCFAAGLGTAWSFAYLISMRDQTGYWLKNRASASREALQNVIGVARRRGAQMLRLVYFYSIVSLVAPALFALLAEFYIIGPLHIYLSPAEGYHHTIRLFQDWTLGVQYMRILLLTICQEPRTRLARALCRTVANGWLDPDIRLLTRGFLIPGMFLFLASMVVPAALGRFAVGLSTKLESAEIISSMDQETTHVLVMKMAYPAVLMVLLTAWIVAGVVQAMRKWRSRIKDEVYLIGERLHNYGESRPPMPLSDVSEAKHE